MAASHNHALMPAHAHLNLLGWVSLFLIGAYYRFHPLTDAGRAALLQVYLWIAGTAVLTTGVAAINLGHMVGEPVAIVGSLVILLGIVFFSVLVFRSSAKGNKTGEATPTVQ